jgi:choline dehydrogenase
MQANEVFDYIVVGAGSAGCVLANRLSANPANRVLLLEAGPKDRYPWIHIPVGYFKTMHNPRTDWLLRTEPDPGLNGRSLAWPRGRVLGGSSSINGLLYIRGQAQDYDHWRQLGCTGWSYQDVLPLFKSAEDQERGADNYHGTGGPLAVSDLRARRDICDAYIEAATNLGIPRNRDFNGATQEGAGYFQLTARNGRRCSAAVAYLRPAQRRPNLSIVTGALVHRVIIEDQAAAGILYETDGIREIAGARGEVILSAGAIHSPHILALSGIGPAGQLAALGIDVIHDSPGVGENLQDHLQARAVYASTQPTLNNEVNNPLLKTRIGLEYMVRRSGPMAMGASQVAIFARTDDLLETPDIQFHIQPLSSDEPGKGLHRYAAFTASVCQLRPESRGRVAVTSPDPRTAPVIHPNYLAAAKDQQVIIAGMKLSRRLAETAPLARFVKAELDPGPDVRTDAQFLDHARDTATTIYHPVGTCKMGVDPMAVVDARLRVIGIGRLRVADASIMPTIPSGNTNAPAIMVGEKAAAMLLEDAL